MKIDYEIYSLFVGTRTRVTRNGGGVASVKPIKKKNKIKTNWETAEAKENKIEKKKTEANETENKWSTKFASHEHVSRLQLSVDNCSSANNTRALISRLRREQSN